MSGPKTGTQFGGWVLGGVLHGSSFCSQKCAFKSGASKIAA